MQNKMSARKTKIAKRLESLGIAFDGQKVNGRYVINGVACRNLDEVEAYVKVLEEANARQSVAGIEPVSTKSNPHCIKAVCKECKRVFKHFELKQGMCYCCYEQLEVSKVFRDQQAIEAAYRLHEPIERRLLDECVARAKKLGRPFTEREVFQQAWDKGYELMPAMDRRFVLIKDRVDGMPLWGLAGA